MKNDPHTPECLPGCWHIVTRTYPRSNGNAEPFTITMFYFVCPCGCGLRGPIEIKTGPKEFGAWEWDGNEDAPTLHPSIFCSGQPCKWHGWFQKGVWNWCPETPIAANCLCPGKQT